MIYALVDPNGLVNRKAGNIDPNVQTKAGWKWLPVVVTGDVGFDGSTQVKEGPAITVEASRVVESYTVRNLTADELDSRKASYVELLPALKVLFHLHNRLRAVEGHPVHTMAQFKAALKALL